MLPTGLEPVRILKNKQHFKDNSTGSSHRAPTKSVELPWWQISALGMRAQFSIERRFWRNLKSINPNIAVYNPSCQNYLIDMDLSLWMSIAKPNKLIGQFHWLSFTCKFICWVQTDSKNILVFTLHTLELFIVLPLRTWTKQAWLWIMIWSHLRQHDCVLNWACVTQTRNF